jgi:hypothetical protein
MVGSQYGVWAARGALLVGAFALAGCSGANTFISGVYGTPPDVNATTTATPSGPTRVDFDPDSECPAINIPSNAASYGTPNGSQFSISNFARECDLVSGTTVTIKLGIEGHVILAGAGGGTYSAPLRISIRDHDLKAVYSKVVRVSATVEPGAAQGKFRLVDTSTPITIGLEQPLSSYDIEIGFDGKGMATTPSRKKKRG